MSIHHVQTGKRYVRVRTDFVYPPIPDRSSDWCATDDNRYDGGNKYIAYGATEADAIEELLEQIDENE